MSKPTKKTTAGGYVCYCGKGFISDSAYDKHSCPLKATKKKEACGLFHVFSQYKDVCDCGLQKKPVEVARFKPTPAPEERETGRRIAQVVMEHAGRVGTKEVVCLNKDITELVSAQRQLAKEELLEEVEQLMLDRIYYIGEELPQENPNDKRTKFVLLGTPQEFLAKLKQEIREGKK